MAYASKSSVFWAIIALMLGSSSQQSFSGWLWCGDLFGDSLWPTRTSPFICLADLIAEVICICMGRKTVFTRPANEAALKPGTRLMKLSIFLLGVLPQAIKLFSMGGIPVTQAVASIYLASQVVHAIHGYRHEDNEKEDNEAEQEGTGVRKPDHVVTPIEIETAFAIVKEREARKAATLPEIDNDAVKDAPQPSGNPEETNTKRETWSFTTYYDSVRVGYLVYVHVCLGIIPHCIAMIWIWVLIGDKAVLHPPRTVRSTISTFTFVASTLYWTYLIFHIASISKGRMYGSLRSSTAILLFGNPGLIVSALYVLTPRTPRVIRYSVGIDLLALVFLCAWAVAAGLKAVSGRLLPVPPTHAPSQDNEHHDKSFRPQRDVHDPLETALASSSTQTSQENSSSPHNRVHDLESQIHRETIPSTPAVTSSPGIPEPTLARASDRNEHPEPNGEGSSSGEAPVRVVMNAPDTPTRSWLRRKLGSLRSKLRGKELKVAGLLLEGYSAIFRVFVSGRDVFWTTWGIVNVVTAAVAYAVLFQGWRTTSPGWIGILG